ncbi:MAG: hypothetical protein GQE15_24490 [Archangiaceae bacterium]|nr:hypothetical protein [Archangiaceae bacterium]
MKGLPVFTNSRAPLPAPFWIAVFALGLAGGCQCKQTLADPRPVAPVVNEQRNRDLAALRPPIGGIPEQLQAEADSRLRDSETITLEQVVEASKVPFEAQQQVLGRTVLALYCGTATSPDGMMATVCEFPTLEQATRGAAEIAAVRGKVSGWQSKAKKKSVLELVVRSDAKKESVDAVLAAFDRL